jgi:polar amino acid transport system substrate-binding protein
VSSLYVGLLFILATGQLQAEEPRRTLNAAFVDFPPMAYFDANGQPAGSVIELTNSVAAESGLSINWIGYPIRRIYKGLRTGEIDFWPGSQAIPALQDFTLETPSIGVDITLCAFSLDNTPQVTDLRELSEHQLVLIRGYTYRAQLDEVFAKSIRKPIVAPNHEAAILLLQKGRAKYLISYHNPILRKLKGNPYAETRCDVLDSWPLVYVVSRHSSDAQSLVDTLTEGYRRVSASRPETLANHEAQNISVQQNKRPE